MGAWAKRVFWSSALGLGVCSCIELAPAVDDPDAGACAPPVLGQATVIATNQGQPFDVLADGDQIWWSDEEGGAVRASADGSEAMSIELPQGIQRITALRLDGEFLYLSAFYSGAILRTPRTGSVATVWADSQRTVGLALDDQFVYWADDPSSTIRRAAKSDASAAPEDFAVGQTSPRFIAVDGSHVYWSNKFQGIRRMAKTSGAVEHVADVPAGSEVWAVVVDDAPDGFVYWREGDAEEGRVMRARKGGDAASVLADDEPGPRLLALDATHLYWTGNASQSVSRVPLAGGCKELLVTAQPGAHGVAVSDTHLFWTSWTLGTISRTVKRP